MKLSEQIKEMKNKKCVKSDIVEPGEKWHTGTKRDISLFIDNISESISIKFSL